MILNHILEKVIVRCVFPMIIKSNLLKMSLVEISIFGLSIKLLHKFCLKSCKIWFRSYE